MADCLCSARAGTTEQIDRLVALLIVSIAMDEVLPDDDGAVHTARKRKQPGRHECLELIACWWPRVASLVRSEQAPRDGAEACTSNWLPAALLHHLLEHLHHLRARRLLGGSQVLADAHDRLGDLADAL